MSPSHRANLATSLALIFCAGIAAASPQQKSADVPIKIESTLVNVPVIVSDRQGRYISGLKLADFRLYDDGAPQPVSFFETSEQPLNIALLLDTSRSTFEVIDDIKEAARDFLKEMRPRDRAMIVSFDYDVHELSPLTSDRRALDRAIDGARIGDYFGTTLRDAVYEVTERSLKRIDGRKAIILLTDGKDFGSQVSETDLLAVAAESDAMIYSVFYETNSPQARRNAGRNPFPRGRRGGWGRRPNADRRSDRQARNNKEAIRFMSQLSEVSAGRFYESEVADLKKTFNLIAEELRHQYVLGFYPDAARLDGNKHRLKVEVTTPNAAVRARRSYTAGRADRER
ncbi:MAG TPA: VWA domain-containing protein [Blastocatellia bacterium]|nr:VWA domain-containing protein [Blastocatellia bacterium]